MRKYLSLGRKVILILMTLSPGLWAENVPLNLSWDDGITMASKDKAFNLRLGGCVVHDWAFFTRADEALADILGPLRNGSEFRYARLYTSGTVYQQVIFKAEYDFAGGKAAPKEVYAGLADIFGANLRLRLGHFKEPLGLEELSGNFSLTFMERALTSIFTPSYNSGLDIAFFQQRVTAAAGLFRETDAAGNGSSHEYQVTGRITGLPWQSADGRYYWHLGTAASYRRLPDQSLALAARPEIHLSPSFINAGLSAKQTTLLGFEGALNLGAWALQGEYIHAALTLDSASPNYSAAYIQTSCFLTGDHHPYDGKKGVIGKVKPAKNFPGSAGAWELALRYSLLNLEDAGVNCGKINDFLFGLNWYWNPNTRLMLDFVHAQLESVGSADCFQTRMQFDF